MCGLEPIIGWVRTSRPVARDDTTAPASRKRGSSLDAISDLAGSLSHDFNNLLMVMRNCGVFLREDLDAGDPRQEYVNDLLEAAERAEHLVSQLQAFGRTQMLRPEYVKPADLIRNVSETLRRLVPEDVDLRLSIGAKDATVFVDPAQFQVVVVNLMSWAASRVGGSRRIWLSLAKETLDFPNAPEGSASHGEFVRLVVAKTGKGLDESDRKRLFEPKLLSEGRSTANTDLRLASVYGIVEQSGGHIDVESEPGRGTQIKVYLPVVSVENVRAFPAKRSPPTSLNGSEVILLVEDDTTVRRMVRDALERHGYTVFEASDGSDALRVAAMFDTPPDLLITDLVMPELSGRELIEVLKVENRLTKVLLMSGHTDDEVLKRASPAERYPFIKKPFSHKELAIRVREVLDD